jgi:hypothetical protein
VDVGVGHARPNRGQDLVELARPKLLACGASRDDVGCRDVTGDGARLRAERGERCDRGPEQGFSPLTNID